MSTRCQVKVTQPNESITLYHHTDGYPEYMIPMIARAYHFQDETSKKYYHDGKDWRKGRAGKVAGLICWSDPGTFEPEDTHTLHGDIEYYYLINVIDEDKPRWEVSIYESQDGFWDHPTVDHMKLTCDHIDIETLLIKYPDKWSKQEVS
jgi:hypothetical protein